MGLFSTLLDILYMILYLFLIKLNRIYYDWLFFNVISNQITNQSYVFFLFDLIYRVFIHIYVISMLWFYVFNSTYFAETSDLPLRVNLAICHSVFVKGDSANFDVHPSTGVEAIQKWNTLLWTTITINLYRLKLFLF